MSNVLHRFFSITNTFSENKQGVFATIKDLKLQLEHDAIALDAYQEKIEEIEKTFEDLIHKTWKNLMR